MARGIVDGDVAGRDKRLARRRLWAGAIAGATLLMSVLLLSWASTGGRVAAAATFDGQVLEQRADAAIVRWRQDQRESDDQSANADDAEPISLHDGLYAGTATTMAAIHVVTFRVRVANGIGTGTQSRLDCGVAPLSLRIAPSGKVNGIALIFGATCLKTELTIRGQALGGVLLLRLGNQHVELAKLAN